jgi:hypothetical protein
MNLEEQNLNEAKSPQLNIGAVRRSILGALNGAKKNSFARKNTPHIDSREYALAHGKLEGINIAIDIVKKYCA